jgi:hypothetical protein
VGNKGGEMVDHGHAKKSDKVEQDDSKEWVAEGEEGGKYSVVEYDRGTKKNKRVLTKDLTQEEAERVVSEHEEGLGYKKEKEKD